MTKELWDIYNKDKQLTDVIKERGSTIEDGEYNLVVLAWIKGVDGRYLISKRAHNIMGAGKWQATGGCVLSGETSRDGLIREIKEEIGLDLPKEKFKLVKSLIVGETSGWIADCWHIFDTIDIKRVVCQEEEVSEVCWATLGEIERLIVDDQFFHGRIQLEFIRELKSK